MSNYIHHVSDTQIETKSENLSTNDTNIFEDYENICKNSSPESSGVGELPSDIRIKNFSSNDSMPFDEAYKTNFQNEETAYNSLQNNEIELKEDQQRYFHTKTLEELKTKSDIIPSNNSNSRIFTTTKDEKRYKMKNHKKCKKIRNKKAENDLFDLTDINRDFEAEMILKDKDIYDYLNKSIDFEGIIDKKRSSKSNYWGNIPQPKTYGPLRIASKSNALVKNIIVNKYDKILSNDIKPEKITPKKNTGERAIHAPGEQE